MCGMPHGSRYMVALDLILEFLTGDEMSGRHSDGDLIGDFKIGAFPIKIRWAVVVHIMLQYQVLQI